MRATTFAAFAVAALAAACGSSGKGFAPSDAGADGSFNVCGGNDCDHDGYAAPADCDDTNDRINPEAYDFPGDGVDDDCSGKADDPIETCETIPATSPGSPTDFARAADLCAQRSITTAGVPFDPLLHAAWGQVQGLGPGQRLWTSLTKTQQVDIVSSFGMNAPRRGLTMAGFATGPWNTPDPRSSTPLDDPTFHLNDACSDIPLDATDCAALSNGAPGGGVSVQDWAELTLSVRVPSNAGSMVFDFAFFSSEFNQFWNASLNDVFFVLVTSQSFQGQDVAKDANGLAIDVNSGFFQLCPPFPGPAGLSQDKAAALQPCVGLDGDAKQNVAGSVHATGYDGAAVSTDDTVRAQNGNLYVYGGGSGWLTGSFAVAPREQIQVRVIIADTFDGLKDSAVLLDAIRWQKASETGVTRPPVK